MTNRIEITPEMVKLAQQRIRATGGDVRQEIARHVAQESVFALDPEHGFLVDEDTAFSRDDRLVAAFDVNDVVVNGVRFDVRIVGDDGRVSLPRYLDGRSYMSCGTLAVAINTDRTASVVAFIDRADWELQDKNLRNEDKLVIRADRANSTLLTCWRAPLPSLLPRTMRDQLRRTMICSDLSATEQKFRWISNVRLWTPH